MMVSEFIVFRLASNDINFMKLDSTIKLKFYTKLRNDGTSKDKFFRLCFQAFMDDDKDLLTLLAKEKYKKFIEDEYKIKKVFEERRKSENTNTSTRFTSQRRLDSYDIEYYFNEE